MDHIRKERWGADSIRLRLWRERQTRSVHCGSFWTTVGLRLNVNWTTRYVHYVCVVLAAFAFYLFAIIPVFCEEHSQSEKTAIYNLYHHGKANTAIRRLETLISNVFSTHEKTVLRRDLLEICVAAFNWRCVFDTINSMLPSINADKALAPLLADVAVANLKLGIWYGNGKMVDQMQQ